MQNKCQEYKDIELTYSALGIQWSRNVRSCLQKVLANKILVPAPSGIVNCEVVTKAFFNEHLDCYLKGPISYCSLPFTDKWKIIEHGTGILFSSHWYETLSTAAKLLKNCGMRK